MLSWKHILCFSQKFKELKIENYAHILCLSSSPRQTVSVLIQTTFRPTFDFHTNSFFLIFFIQIGMDSEFAVYSQWRGKEETASSNADTRFVHLVFH